MVLHRTALPLINASFITVLLFALMHSLIDIDEPELRTPFVMPQVSFVHVPPTEVVTVVVAKAPPPQLVEPTPDASYIEEKFGYDGSIEGEWVEFKREPIDGRHLYQGDRQLVIALGFPPEYPRAALSRGIEGYAIVGFSVNKTGSVIDPFIIESEPRSVFDKSALKGIMKFKYKARMVDGHPVETQGQQYQFTYQLEN